MTTKVYLISVATAFGIGGLVASSLPTAFAKAHRACERVEFKATPQQKANAESLLAGPATCDEDVDVCGFRTAVEQAFGPGAFNGPDIKRRGVSSKWETNEQGVEELWFAAQVCKDGSFVTAQPE